MSSRRHVDEIEGARPTGGEVRRRELGVEAFGVNWFELPPNAEGVEHDESDSQQEEVNVVIAGRALARRRRGGRGARGTCLRFDPETTRMPIAGPDGMTFVGSARGAAATRREALSERPRR